MERNRKTYRFSATQISIAALICVLLLLVLPALRNAQENLSNLHKTRSVWSGNETEAESLDLQLLTEIRMVKELLETVKDKVETVVSATTSETQKLENVLETMKDVTKEMQKMRNNEKLERVRAQKLFKMEDQLPPEFKQIEFLRSFLPLSALQDEDSNRTSVYVANIGCGKSGYDVLNDLISKVSEGVIARMNGLFVDPKPECEVPQKSQIKFVQRAVGAGEIASLVARGEHEYFWVLKVDIDSYDCGILEAILAAGHQPAVISIETMGCFPPPLRFSLLTTTATLAHDNSKMIGERDWPKNCCLYGCSPQKSIDVVQVYGYVPVRAFEGDMFFVHATKFDDMQDHVRDMVDPAWANTNNDADFTKGFRRNDAGWVSGELAMFNLHSEHMQKWTVDLAGQPEALFADACNVFKERCSPDRLAQSTWQLSLDKENTITCPL